MRTERSLADPQGTVTARPTALHRCPTLWASLWLATMLLGLAFPAAAQRSFARTSSTAPEAEPTLYGSWGNFKNWDPPGEGPPGARDSATVSEAPTLVVSGVTVNELTLSGVLFGPGPLDVNARLILANGRLLDAYPSKATNFPSGSFEYRSWGETLLFGQNVVSVRFQNYGTARVFEGIVYAQHPTYGPPGDYGATWANKPGSEMHIDGRSRWLHLYDSPDHFATFTNELGAMIIKSNRFEEAHIEWRLHNDGIIDVREGGLWFRNPRRLNGPMLASADATLRLETPLDDVIEIGPAATFSGAGTVVLEGNSSQPFFDFEGARIVTTAMSITNVTITGDALVFTRPVNWGGPRGTVWRGTEPVHFLLGGHGRGLVERPIVNAGVFTDHSVVSGFRSSWANIPPGSYTVAPSLSGFAATAQGWLTNFPPALVLLSANSTLIWNLMNQGAVHAEPGERTRISNIAGHFHQSWPGQTYLNSSILSVSNLVLDGQLFGSGNITCYNAQVSGVLSPASSSGPFGRLLIHSVGTRSIGPTNRIVLAPETVFEVDLGAPGTTNDFFDIAAASKSAAPVIAGRINVRAREGFGPGVFPFYQYCCGSTVGHNLRFGDVPPGYRFALVTNTATRVFAIVVTRPEMPTATLRRGGDGITLDIVTLAGLPYRVDYTDALFQQPWQFLTNLMGDGRVLPLPVAPSAPGRLFRITEGP